ncbi:hypothetical protein K493DRAFT_310318 [Basidiobolus meristosporus CBS 931.73]|uniref:Uncharacterized protein n=1 Tax=Basidiobolus meristosporus CBS 931.73 TaxID=1314790 RepID=A0A1Y1ZAP6_9FUNG|nr:hypothetical protein K493DRAFT_310318 [Basidiobolus meristosporus CBS 931.73]|eukprot:ORY07067.1 hypothetical protein K493DRAFT_310318 [Basidiobolus meristosporus CBS 931.73]
MENQVTTNFLDDARKYYHILSQTNNNAYTPLRRIQRRRNLEKAKHFCYNIGNQRVKENLSVNDLTIRLQEYMTRVDTSERIRSVNRTTSASHLFAL